MSDVEDGITITVKTDATGGIIRFTVDDIPRLLADQAATLRYVQRLESLVPCQTCREGKQPPRRMLDEDGTYAEISGKPWRWGHAIDDAYWFCEDRPVMRLPQAGTIGDQEDGLPGVAGDECSIMPAELEYRCRVAIAEEQARMAPDSMLIALLCDSVRLAREYEANRNVLPLEDQMYTLRMVGYWLDAALKEEQGHMVRFYAKEAWNFVHNALERGKREGF